MFSLELVFGNWLFCNLEMKKAMQVSLLMFEFYVYKDVWQVLVTQTEVLRQTI